MAKAPSKRKPPKTRVRKSCNCIKQVNEALKPFNTEIDTGFSINFTTGVVSSEIYVATRKIETKKRTPAKLVVCSYCPFCGKKF